MSAEYDRGVLDGYKQVIHTMRLRIAELLRTPQMDSNKNPTERWLIDARIDELSFHIRMYENQIQRMAVQDVMDEIRATIQEINRTVSRKA